MANGEKIAAQQFCASHQIEISFLDSLSELGLVQITRTDEAVFIDSDQLPELEKLVRFHYDMDINLEGIEAIHHLLQEMKHMQEQMRSLRNRLSLYEQVE